MGILGRGIEAESGAFICHRIRGKPCRRLRSVSYTHLLAARVSLSSTPVFERLKRLENSGYIKKYIAVLDAEKLNQGFVVFLSLIHIFVAVAVDGEEAVKTIVK